MIYRVFQIPATEEAEPFLILQRTDRRVAEQDVYLLRGVGVRAFIPQEDLDQ